MKVNDVLRKEEVAVRILVIKDDRCFCINCNAESMPAWIPANSLEDYTPDTALMIDTNMTARQKQAAHERFTMIAPMLAFLTDDKERKSGFFIRSKLRSFARIIWNPFTRQPKSLLSTSGKHDRRVCLARPLRLY